MKSLYRKLIVLSLLLYLPGIVLPFFRASLTDEVAFRWLGWHGYGGWITVTGKTFLLLTLADLVALLGMYCFQDWGRASFLALNIVWIALLPFCGLVVVTAWEMTFHTAYTTLFGAVLALAYGSELKSEFT